MLPAKTPKISVLIPTLNASGVLEACLKSISTQLYPKDELEIIIADGGSTDTTREIATKYGARIVENTLKTGEAGKMAALKVATGDYIALIDSDNILPNPSWLTNMIQPLIDHPQAIGSEPWSYTLRKQDGFITRYCALTGANDPLCLFLGNYDRINNLTGKWTELPIEQQDLGNYLLVKLTKNGLPTIGANGTIFKASVLKQYAQGDYLFDIDLIAQIVEKNGSAEFIKVKEGIIHTFCESDIKKFARKQKRRIADFMFHRSKGTRSYPWNKIPAKGYAKFILYCVTVVPLAVQSIKGYKKIQDPAWFFHPLACEITLWEYGKGMIVSFFKKGELKRDSWKQ